jgi:hypothetical protein
MCKVAFSWEKIHSGVALSLYSNWRTAIAVWISAHQIEGSAAAMNTVYCSRSSLWERFFRTRRILSREYALQVEHFQG